MAKNRSMEAKHMKARKEAVKEMTLAANNFGSTSFFRESRKSNYPMEFWLYGKK